MLAAIVKVAAVSLVVGIVVMALMPDPPRWRR